MKSITHAHNKGTTLAVVLGVALFLTLGFAQASSAQAFWWWGAKPAHGQENDTATVTIKKYIDGKPATAANAKNHSFPMSATWDDPEGEGEGSGSYTLNASTTPVYQAQTTALNKGASYSTHEVLTGDVVGAACTQGGKPFALVGYSVGNTQAQAKSASVSTTSPSFSNLQKDQVVIVWNKTCDTATTTPPGGSSGQISGEVTGGQTGNPGELVVTSIEAEKTTATANGKFEDGWRYVFNITVPTNEPNLSMKFANWLEEGGVHTIPVANNMRISSAQANNGGATVLLSAADTYASPDLHMTGDLNPGQPGLQVQVVVEVAIPTSTFNGVYSTSYGVRTLE